MDRLPIDTEAQRQHIVDRLRQQVLPLLNLYQTPKALNAVMDSGEIKRYLPDWYGDPESLRFHSNFLEFLYFAWMNKSSRVPKLAARYRQENERMLKKQGKSDDFMTNQEKFIAFALSHEPPDVGQFA